MSYDPVKEAISILCENYSLAELEEKLGLKLEDLEEGLMEYVERHYKRVKEMLKEDLFL